MRHNAEKSQAENEDSILTKAVKKYSSEYFEFFMNKILKLNMDRLQDIGDGKYQFEDFIFSRSGYVENVKTSKTIPLYLFFSQQWELSPAQANFFILEMISDNDDFNEPSARALLRHYNAIRYSLRTGGLL